MEGRRFPVWNGLSNMFSGVLQHYKSAGTPRVPPHKCCKCFWERWSSKHMDRPWPYLLSQEAPAQQSSEQPVYVYSGFVSPSGSVKARAPLCVSARWRGAESPLTPMFSSFLSANMTVQQILPAPPCLVCFLGCWLWWRCEAETWVLLRSSSSLHHNKVFLRPGDLCRRSIGRWHQRFLLHLVVLSFYSLFTLFCNCQHTITDQDLSLSKLYTQELTISHKPLHSVLYLQLYSQKPSLVFSFVAFCTFRLWTHVFVH